MDRLDDDHDAVREIVLSLNHTDQWMLNTLQINEYTIALTPFYPLATVDPSRFNQIIKDYHAVRVLLDATYRDHNQLWSEQVQYIRRLLNLKIKSFGLQADRLTIIDGMVQDICQAIFKGLGGFKYKSSLRTWITAIVNNNYRQYWRKLNNQSQASNEQSLDDVLGMNLADPIESMESLVGFRVLYAHCIAVLAQHDDQRLVMIFQYLLIEKYTLDQIAQKLSLSITRIYELNKAILAILSVDPVIIRWRSDLADNVEPNVNKKF